MSIALFGTILFALLAYVYLTTTGFVRDRFDAVINGELAELRRTYDDLGRDGLVRAIEERAAQRRSGEIRYLLVDPSFSALAGNLKTWPRGLDSPQGVAEFGPAALGSNAGGKTTSIRAGWETLPDGSRLLVGGEIGDLEQFRTKIYIAFALTGLFVVVLAGAASVSVTRRTVGRIESINVTSRAIMESGLDKRIALHGTQDEWDHLAQNLNSMLDRIERLMDEVKQVSDNVAHDLRTPLTRMRGRLERASTIERNPKTDQNLLSDTIADLDDVLRMFSSLTRISQIETTKETSTFQKVDLLQIASLVTELFDAAAEEKGARVEGVTGEPAFILGDRDLLFDAVSNIVDNAIKHGRDGGGYVRVKIGSNDAGVVLTVSDNGPGIPSHEKEQVLKRFYRLERSRRTPGNGLGLSLVAAVARLHGAHMVLSDNQPGLRVELQFPRALQGLETQQAAAQVLRREETAAARSGREGSASVSADSRR